MATMVQAKKKIALLHRHPREVIPETNAAFPYLEVKGIDVLTFKKFPRTGGAWKFWKSLFWIIYAPMLVIGKGYDVIYCDDSYPFYPIFVKLVSPKSKVVLRIGDLHLMYYYSGMSYNVLHFIEKIGWRMADQISAISVEMASYLVAEIGEPIRVIFDPVDFMKFPEMPSYRGVTKRVMFHGALTKNKQVDLLLSAARLMPSINFLIAGDGPDRKRLEGQAPSNVTFKGWVPHREIYKLIHTADVGVALRSNNPGNDYVVTSAYLQYGAMLKPCLVTRRKVFGDYEWQFSDVNEMIDKLRYLLQHPEEGEKLQKHILENHDAKKIATQIWDILIS